MIRLDLCDTGRLSTGCKKARGFEYCGFFVVLFFTKSHFLKITYVKNISHILALKICDLSSALFDVE